MGGVRYVEQPHCWFQLTSRERYRDVLGRYADEWKVASPEVRVNHLRTLRRQQRPLA